MVFEILPYSPELDKINHSFGILMPKTSRKSLNGKELKLVVIEVVVITHKLNKK